MDECYGSLRAVGKDGEWLSLIRHSASLGVGDSQISLDFFQEKCAYLDSGLQPQT